MIVCCYTRIDRQWPEQELANKLALLPAKLQVEAFRKREWMDRQLSVAGKLLVLEVMRRLDYDKLTLSDLRYNDYHRPYFDAPVDFNIAHSGNLVICGGTNEGKIGIDIEQIKAIDLSDYSDHFTNREWGKINKAQNRGECFFDFWTRKEAILKVIGTGAYTPLQEIDVSDDLVIYKGVTYYLSKISTGQGYSCHIASNIKTGDIDPRHISF